MRTLGPEQSQDEIRDIDETRDTETDAVASTDDEVGDDGIDENIHTKWYTPEMEEREWEKCKKKWQDMEEDHAPESEAEDPAEEKTAKGRSRHGPAVEGCDLSYVVRVAFELGLNAEAVALIESLAAKLKEVTPDRHHTVLKSFLTGLLTERAGEFTPTDHQSILHALLYSY